MDPNLIQLGIPTSTLLAMAAMFLGLAVIVQVVQEIYKFLRTSKASVYRMVLEDFFGSWVEQLYEPGPAARFHVRGAFQWFKSRPTGKLLPLSKEELLQAMDELPTGWMGETLKVLKEEARLRRDPQSGPSSRLDELRTKLDAEVKASTQAEGAPGPEARDAKRMFEFLGPEGDGDPDSLLERFYQEFFPERIRAEEEFATLKRNFEHAYDRRNLRYSFLFAIFVAVFLNFPFDAIFERAQALSLDEAIALADDVQEIRASLEESSAGEPEQDGEAGDGDSQADEGGDQSVSDGQEETGEETGGDEADAEGQEIEKRLRVAEALVVRLDPDSACGSVPVWARGVRRMREILAGTAERPAECIGTQQPVEPPEEAEEASDGDGKETVTVDVPGTTGWPGLMAYLLNCLVTALLVSFGAPFWDRVTDSLLARSRREKNA